MPKIFENRLLLTSIFHLLRLPVTAFFSIKINYLKSVITQKPISHLKDNLLLVENRFWFIGQITFCEKKNWFCAAIWAFGVTDKVKLV